MAGKRTSFKDVEIEFFSGGLDAVRTIAGTGEDLLSRSVLEKAADSLESRGQDVTGFRAMITELHGEKGTGKGRTPPALGDRRNYKGQQVKDGGVFGRIPLDTIGTEKGGVCNVQFAQDDEGPYLIVRPGAYTAPDGTQNNDDEGEDVDLD